MSIAFANAEDLASEQSVAASLRRTAFYLTSQGQPLFAWLHHAVDENCATHGVVICPSIGYEQLHAHRSLRHLAEALAHKNIPVLRFDYHGTGDSAGCDEDSNRLATWQANVRDAIAWMRDELGCQQVSVIGLRAGATLAALTAAEYEIDNLVLWSPVVKGRAYVREMQAIGLTAEAAMCQARDASGDIEAAGFALAKQTAEEFRKIDLLNVAPRCQQALIVARDDVPADTRLVEHFTQLGIPTEQIAQPGYLDMMAEPHDTQVPFQAIDQITNWLAARAEREATSEFALDFATTRASCAVMKPALGATSGLGTQSTIREQTHRISSDPDLFGIFTEPTSGANGSLPLIVLLNAGAAYRIGPGRLHVTMARSLAAVGFRTLRVDVSGLGDSPVADPQHENDPYAATVFRDIDLTLKHLQSRFGTRHVVLVGLCSGAYDAFQAAVQLPNPVLVESVLINPLTYFWKDGMAIDTATTNRLIARHYYLTALMNPKKWRRLFSGESRLGIAGAIKRLLGRGVRSQQSKAVVATALCKPHIHLEYSHPQLEDLPADLARVAAFGRHLAIFCSATDPGLFILRHYARRQANLLRRAGTLDECVIENADHTFSKRAARHALIAKLTEHLRKRYDH